MLVTQPLGWGGLDGVGMTGERVFGTYKPPSAKVNAKLHFLRRSRFMWKMVGSGMMMMARSVDMDMAQCRYLESCKT